MTIPVSDGLPPLTIAAKGGPLTCADHDMNIARLLDRVNHTGTQPVSTITGLKEYVTSWLQESGLSERIDNLTFHIFDPEGQVQSLINSSEAQLRSEIGPIRDLVNSLESQLNNLTTRVDINSNQINNHEQVLQGLEARVTQNEVDIDELQQSLGNIPTNGFLPEVVWKGSVPGQSDILMLFYDTINDIRYWGAPTAIVGGSLSGNLEERATLNFGSL